MNRFRALAAALLAITLSAANPKSLAQTIQVSKDNRTVAITTTDEAEATADRAVVSVGFTTYGADQDQTYADASKTSNAIMKALKDAGVKPDAIESTRQHLSQIDDSDKLRYAKGIRFVFSQEWAITVSAKNAADVLHLAVISGANNSGDIDWQLKDEQALESEAAEKALIHAQEIAERMAKGLKATLGPLVYASNQAPSTRFNDGYGRRSCASASSCYGIEGQTARNQPREDHQIRHRIRRLLAPIALKPQPPSDSAKLKA